MDKSIIAGGMLTGNEIYNAVQEGKIDIIPFNEDQINPNSYNLTLHPELKVYTEDVLDCKKNNPTKTIIIPEEGLVLQPGEFYLGRSYETTGTDYYIPSIDGRSSIGRLGISIHITAGFGDIGFTGTWTLEITVEKPVRVYPGMEVAQVSWVTPYGDTSYKYNGRYQGQISTTPSRMFEDKKGTYRKEDYNE